MNTDIHCLVSRVFRIQDVQLYLTVTTNLNSWLKVDANLVADVCRNHRGETVFVVRSAEGKLFILPHFCHPSILNHHPSPSSLSALDRTSYLVTT